MVSFPELAFNRFVKYECRHILYYSTGLSNKIINLHACARDHESCLQTSRTITMILYSIIYIG